MTHLPKHLRPRWRYLGVRIETRPDASFERRDFQSAVWTSGRRLFGDASAADLDLTVLRFDREGPAGAAVVRTRRGAVERARAALACVEAVESDPVGLRVAGTSGTVRACEEKYIRRPPEPPEQRNVAFEDSDRAAVLRDDRVDVRTDDGFSGATTLDLH